ncbi:hypothetical protein AB1Y20_017216 [Prymnesium parvum]|uniref:Methyltransferase small domain-containing protein n=1 Tax=Prymnesium parvum TaxID=97485 RepID=A0AB34IB18_PRYPA
MRLKALLAELQAVRTWAEPKVELEQYPTPPDIAAHMLMSAHERGDVEDALVADLGCGGAILGIAAALLGASHVLAVDIDAEAVDVAQENVARFGVPVDLIAADALRLSLRRRGAAAGARPSFIESPFPTRVEYERWLASRAAAVGGDGSFDTVLMNPPFGTQKHSNGVDMAFLQQGLALCRPGGAVYSLHKSSTRAFIAKKAKEWGAASEVIAQLRFELPRMYKHHTKASVEVDVDFWRLEQGAAPASAADAAGKNARARLGGEEVCLFPPMTT